MTTSSSAVGGSQIDVQSLASQLVAAERKPLDDAITRENTRVTTQVSAIGTLMGALSTFRSALSSLKTVDVFAARKASSGDDTIFTASATSKATPGTYEIEVEKLAKAHQISSKPFAAGSTAVVGTGTLTLSLGATGFSVAIDSSNNTVAGIRDAINAASDNPGVRATLIQGTDGAHLVLTSSTTGAASAITVATTGGDGGLAKLTYNSAATTNYALLAPAQDAKAKIAGIETTSTSNSISTAIDGVTINLVAASDVGTTTTLSVGYDNDAATSKITGFVTAFNALTKQMAKLDAYDATSKTAGPMLGDSLLTGIESQLRRTISDAVQDASGSYKTLASIGITTQADGTLAVDSNKLQTALSNNFDAVSTLFGSKTGVAAKLYSQVDTQLQTGGGLDSRSKTLVGQQKDLSTRSDAVDARMTSLLARYVQQFTALDNLLSQLQVTSSFLGQQITSMQNFNAAASK
jgi:flagellar hook-associated protein 2